MTLAKFLRFKNLFESGVVKSRASLKYQIEHDDFPEGRLLGPNTRAWTIDEVELWLASRPRGKVARSVTSQARVKAKAAKAQRLKEETLTTEDSHEPNEG